MWMSCKHLSNDGELLFQSRRPQYLGVHTVQRTGTFWQCKGYGGKGYKMLDSGLNKLA